MKVHPSVQTFNSGRAFRTFILFVMAVVLVLLATGCSSAMRREMLGKGNRFDESIAGRILPGHYGYNQCEPYAVALSQALDDKGITNQKLAYEWVTPDGNRGLHAVVLFERDGSYWIMDNVCDKPKKVTGKTDLELCRKFSQYVVRMQNWTTAEWAQPQDVETLLHPPILKYLTIVK